MNTGRHGAIGVLFLALLGTIAAAQPSTTFVPGQKVEFEFLGAPKTGVVVEVQDNGWCIVEFERLGKPKKRRFSPKRLRVVADAGTPAAAEAAAAVEAAAAAEAEAAAADQSGSVDAAPMVDPSFALVGRRDDRRRIDPETDPSWQYRPVRAAASGRADAYRFELGYGQNVFARPGRVIEIEGPSGPGVLASSVSGNRRTGLDVELIALDAVDGGPDRIGPFKGPANRQLVSAGRDGATLALTEYLGTDRFVEIFRTSEQALTPHLRIEPATDRQTPRRPWAEVVGVNRALTVLTHELELWDLESGLAIWSIACSPRGEAFVDAARTHVFLPQADGTTIVEAWSGRAVGRLDVMFTNRDRVAVRPDGRRIAWLDDRSIVLMDLVDDAPPQDRLGLPVGIRGKRLEWLDTKRVLVDGELVFDVVRRASDGRLDPGSWTSVACAHGIVWINRTGASIGTSHELLGRSVEGSSARAGNLLERARIAVEVSTGDGKADRRLRKKFAARLEQMGLDVDGDGEIRLLIGARPDGAERRSYFSTLDGQRHTKTVNKTRWSAAIEHRGQLYWQVDGVHDDIPMVLSIREGQTIDEAARAERRSLSEVILDVQLPTFVGDQRLDEIALIDVPEPDPKRRRPATTANARARDDREQ